MSNKTPRRKKTNKLRRKKTNKSRRKKTNQSRIKKTNISRRKKQINQKNTEIKMSQFNTGPKSDKVIITKIKETLQILEKTQGKQKKINLVLDLFNWIITYALDFLNKHKKFKDVVEKKIEELYTDALYDNDLKFAGNLSKIYLTIFKKQLRHDNIMDLITIFKKALQTKQLLLKRKKAVIHLEYTLSYMSKDVGKVLVDVFQIQKPPWYNSLKKSLTCCRIKLVKIYEKFQKKRLCTKNVTKVFKDLKKNFGVNIMSLIVSSSMSLRACKCYIHAASNAGLFLVSKDKIESRCKAEKNDYTMLFLDNDKIIDKVNDTVNFATGLSLLIKDDENFENISIRNSFDDYY